MVLKWNGPNFSLVIWLQLLVLELANAYCSYIRKFQGPPDHGVVSTFSSFC